jgi:hypothetical protein
MYISHNVATTIGNKKTYIEVFCIKVTPGIVAKLHLVIYDIFLNATVG